MTKFLLSLIGFAIAMGFSILTMIFGYGINPVSWGWVIFGHLVGAILGALFQLAE